MHLSPGVATALYAAALIGVTAGILSVPPANAVPRYRGLHRRTSRG